MSGGQRVGTSHWVDVGKCMVIGCGKTALFQNASSRNGTTNRSGLHGYCRTHKALAVTNNKVLGEKIEDRRAFQERYGNDDAHAWRIFVDDGPRR